MHDDPFAARDRGTRRVRVVTAWVAAGTVVGTGAVALSVAAAERNAAAAIVQSGTGDQSGAADRSGAGDDAGSDGFTPPLSPPGRGSGSGHASSGGS